VPATPAPQSDSMDTEDGWENDGTTEIVVDGSTEGTPRGMTAAELEEVVAEMEADAAELLAAALDWAPELFDLDNDYYDEDDEESESTEVEESAASAVDASERDSADGEEAEGTSEEDGWVDGDPASVELSIVLCDDATIQSLNREWRGKDAPTDVLSFSLREGDDDDPGLLLPIVMLGDLVLSIDTARMQAEERGHSLRDELRVLLVHGLLHLLGFDHEAGASEEEEMTKAEQELLSIMGWSENGLIASSRKAADDERPPGGAGRGARGSPVVLAASPVQETGARRRSSADIQLVALDMDGTLLNSRSVVSPATADAIHAALGKGVMVMLATGKARVAAERALHSVGLAGDGLMVASSVPGIFLQGLAVYGRGGAEIPGKSLSPSVVAAAFEWAAREGVPLVSFHGDECRTLRMTLELEQLHTVYYEPLAHVMPTVAALLSGPPVKKLLFMSKPPVIDALRPEWARRLSGTGAAITQAVPSMLEVLPAGVNKGVALQSLVPSLGFTMDQVMAVGDGLNDLEMVSTAGWGVAMGNAVPQVRSSAKAVVASHDEDGVAEALSRFVL